VVDVVLGAIGDGFTGGWCSYMFLGLPCCLPQLTVSVGCGRRRIPACVLPIQSAGEANPRCVLFSPAGLVHMRRWDADSICWRG
jgi:hypothetical protein